MINKYGKNLVMFFSWLLQFSLLGLIYLYRLFLSPWLCPCCRFSPTCSAYGIEALKTHGGVNGSQLILKRLLKCHPWSKLGSGSGYDPVPSKTDHRGVVPKKDTYNFAFPNSHTITVSTIANKFVQ